MKHELTTIYRQLSSGALTGEEAMRRIRELQQARATATDRTLLATLQWQTWIVSGDSMVPWAHRRVLLCDGAAQQQATLTAKHTHCRYKGLITGGGQPEAVYEQVSLAFFTAVRDILASKPQGPCLVQLVAEENDETRLWAGLSGLIATASLENPLITGQVVLIPAGSTGDQLARFLEECAHAPAGVLRRSEQGWQRQGWQLTAHAPVLPLVADQPCPLREGGVYLITGGLGGLGVLIARDMATRISGVTVVLCGRSLPAAERLAAVASLSRGTSRVVYRQADVTDPEQVEELLASIIAKYGRLNGIIHSAGLLRDGFLLKKSASDFSQVLRPKVAGACHLDRASRDLPLDFFVLFSSMASWAGNVGQADYAAANGFLDQFARYRAQQEAAGQRQGRTLSLAWPHWLEGGMQVDAVSMAQLQQRTGLRSLSTEAGLAALYRSLLLPYSQLLIMHGEPEVMRQALAAQPSMPTLPATVAGAERPQASPVDQSLPERVRDFLRREFSVVLKIPAQRIETKAPLEQYGIDSILAMNLTTRLEESFGTLAKTLFFEYQSIDELAGYFLSSHADTLHRLLPPAAGDVTTRGQEHGQAGNNGAASPPQQPSARPYSRNGSRRSRRPVARPAATVDAGSALSAMPIAIIGLSGRYPESWDLEAFWQNLRDGRDCIVEVPPQRWDWRRYYDADRSREGAHASKWGGFIAGVDEFDPRFFNIAPREAHTIDPQERLFLQHAWQALEDAGYTRDALQTSREGDWSGQVGVYAGVMYGEYNLSGSLASIANRVSYFLNCHGPSLTLDTMCSSSLTAIHLACQDLRLGRTNLALAGGVNVSIHPNKYTMLSRGQFISSDGHCQSFGEGGDGYIPGEGVGVAVLKRLADAERDGDHIWGIIRASALNHGGKTNGYTVPNPHAQAEVIKRALAEAGVEPAQISYIEAHGTGTKLGDPIEIAALGKAFREGARSPSGAASCCLIGSAKSNIGHCESAAGIAGVSKVLLQMRHGYIVPSLHSATLNPHIDFNATPFVVNQTLCPWPRPHVNGRPQPYLAGISSFGAGGSNAHVLIEEYQGATDGGTGDQQAMLVPLSARTAAQLVQRAADLLGFIQRRGHSPSLLAMAHTLQVGREAMEERAAFVAASLDELQGRLRAFVAGQRGEEGCYSGRLREHRDDLARLEGDPAFAETWRRWIAEGELDHLAQWWCKGRDIDWSLLWAHRRAPRRISLPTYPFARERYWAEQSPAVGEGRVSQLHPLVHINASTLSEQRFTSQFAGTEPFLADNGTGNKHLPPLLALEMIHTALDLATPERQGSGGWELRGTAWGETMTVVAEQRLGIALLPQGAERVDVELFIEPIDPAAVSSSISCQTQAMFIATQGEHRVDLALLRAGLTAQSGPFPEGVAQLHRDGAQLLAQWHRPQQPSSTVSCGYTLPPQLLTTLAALLSLSGPGIPQPQRLERSRLYQPCPEDVLLWLRMNAAGDIDVDICDPDGQVCAQFQGLSLIWHPGDATEATVARGSHLSKAPSAPVAPESAKEPGQAPREIVLMAADSATAALSGYGPVSGKPTAIKLLAAAEIPAAPAAVKQTIVLADPVGDRVAAGTTASSAPPLRLFVEEQGIARIAMEQGPLTTLIEPLLLALERARQLPGLKALLLAGNTECWQGDRLACNEAIRVGLFKVLLSFPVPVIAVLPGDAQGAGLLLAALCDFMVCSEGGRYGFTDAGAGLLPTAAEQRFFEERLGAVTARQFLYWSTGWNGSELAARGWACPVVRAEMVRSQAEELAGELAEKSRLALEMLKSHLSRHLLPLVAAFCEAEPVVLDTPAVSSESVLVTRLGDKAIEPEAMIAELQEQIERVEQGQQYRALVVTSAGEDFLPSVEEALAPALLERLRDLLRRCPVPVIAGFESGARGFGWLFGLFCEAMVVRVDGRYGAPALWTDPGLARGITVLHQQRLGQSLGQELLLSQAEMSGAEMHARQGSITACRVEEVLPAALSLAKLWSRWPRPAVEAWMREQQAAHDRLVQSLPLVEMSEKDAAAAPRHGAQPKPFALTSPVVSASISPEGVAVVRMEDREAKNMFSQALVSGLRQAFAHIAQSPACKVVVLTGYENYFATGGTRETLLAIQEGRAKFTDETIFQAPLECLVPVIAAIQGHGIGGGWSFGMFADLVLLSEESRYLSPYMGYGFTPGAGSTLMLPTKIGLDLGRETLLTAREFSGQSLRQRGAGLPVLPRRAVVDQALALAREIARQPREQLVALKHLLCHGLRERLDDTYRREVDMHDQTFVNNVETLARIRATFAAQTPSAAPAPVPVSGGEKALSTASVAVALKTMLAEELLLAPEEIDEDTSFIDLGLDSITGVTWIRRINARYGLEIEATKVYSHPTLRAIAALVAKAGAGADGEHARQPHLPEPVALAHAPAPLPQPLPETSASSLAAVVATLKVMLARELHLQPEEIEEGTPFIDMGLDSITGVTWVRRINEQYGLNIEATKVYSHPSLNEIGHLVLEEIEKTGALPIAAPVPVAANLKVPAAVATACQVAMQAPRTLTSWRRHQGPGNRLHASPVTAPATGPQPIAVIGMAGQFPQSPDLAAFWRNLAEGRNCIAEVPKQRWRLADSFQPGAPVPGKSNCKWFGAVEGYDCFDPLFFNISPTEAECMEPQQRLFLQTCYHSLENSGYSPQSLAGSQCGVFVGCGPSDYHLQSRHHQLSAQGFTGAATSILAARIAYFLDLHGPCLSIDTACSSSLVAMAEACDSLSAGHSDLALAGGVYVMAGPDMHIMTSQAGMLSIDGRCYTFDDRANGFVPGEGVGVVVLKRLADAERDGDRILAVIEGWGINQDGRTNGITAPNEVSQTRLLQSVYRRFAIDPATIQLIEAHGTGTKLGDPIEVAGLKAAFKPFTDSTGYCALGSVKSNIGHCLTAAGAAGMLKLLLALRHRALPPTINFKRLNDHIQLANSPFFINDRLQAWQSAKGQPRRAAISAFGFSGTNAHLVLREHGGDGRPRPAVTALTEAGRVIVPLSARTEAQLRHKAQDLLHFLQEHPQADLLEVAYTLQVGRDAMGERLGLLVDSLPALIEGLQAFLSGAAGNGFLHQGQVKRYREGMQFISQDAEMRAIIVEKWLGQRRLGKLLDLWVKGLDLDWNLLYGAHKPQRLELPNYPFARERYWLSGDIPSPSASLPVSVPPPQQQPVVAAGAGQDPDAVSYLSFWEEQARPVQEQAARHKQVLIVQTAPCFGLEESLRDHYAQDADCRVLLVRLGEKTTPLDGLGWSLGIDDPEGWTRCLHELPSIDALFFLACSQESGDPASCEQVRRNQESNEIQLLRLVKTLKGEHKINGTLDTYILTLDNHRSDHRPGRFWGAGAAGFGYSLAQGNHQFRVRSLDLASEELEDAGNHDALIEALVNEPPSDRGEVHKLHQGRRWRQGFLPLIWPQAKSGGLKHRGVYLIVGGSGIVGRIISRHLLRTCQARVIWMGRSAADSDRMREVLHGFAEFGDRLEYVQADATDEASLRQAITQLKRRHPRLHGAIFSGMVFGTENSIDQTSEDEFRDILQVKTLGTQAFFAALRDEPLDFLCFFSSGQAYAFSGASRLSAYATGIAAADGLVRALQTAAPFPVGIINWGFWQAAVRERIENLDGVSTKSIEALEDEVGIACFERFIASLHCDGGLRQVLCMRASQGVEALMHCSRDEAAALALKGGPVPVVLDEAMIPIPRQQISRLIQKQEASDLNLWMARLLGCQLGRLWSSSPAPVLPLPLAAVRQQCGVIDKFEPWFAQSFNLLSSAGMAAIEDAALIHWQPPEWRGTWDAWRQTKERFFSDADTGPLALLVDDCLEKLPEILQGRLLATDVLFPRASMDKVAGLYRNNAIADSFNEIVAATVVAYLGQRQRVQPRARLRILEIGAGTGGTSAAVFNRLKPYREAVEEYCYTDLSKAFFFHAEQQYLPDSPYIVCRRLDIEQPIAGQRIDIGGYDLVIASNALHATRDIRRTLRHAKSALRHGGFLIVNEMCAATLSTHLTFGLLDGWWLFTDGELRIPGCPGLYPATWQRVLAEEGFAPVLLPGAETQPLGNQVVVACSDGLIRVPPCAVNREVKALTDAAPAAAPIAPPRSTAQTTQPRQDLAAYVRELVLDSLSATLKIAATDIDVDSAFSEYGVDSILGVSFIDRLNQCLALALNTAIIFEFSSVKRLCRHLVAAHGQDIERSRQEHVLANDYPETTEERSLPTQMTGAAATPVPTRSSGRPHSDATMEIAIIGMAGQMPKASNVGQFWDNLLAGVDGVEELPPHYLDQTRLFSPVKQKGKTRCKWGGILDGRDCFDPLFFNISPKEAESMNPHQRLVMQESWNALEDAGYNPKALAGSKTAIFIGAEPSGYVGESFTGLSDAIIASRLSYAMDFNGAAFVVNTGCSSSAVALHLACENLRNGESDLVLAGGVNACLHQEVLVRLDQIEMLSPSGRCFTFDERGDGTIISEGVGLVVLKRLDDALAAGDHIYATICASGMNQDGASNGITAPNGAAQEQLIVDVYERFGIDPRRISYVEAHGTGTRLGDPVETNALVRAFRRFSPDTNWCAVGSAKSHIGHTGAAAGVIGLIKVLLSLRHQTLPRLLNFAQMNPLIQFEGSPFAITSETRPWPAVPGVPRLAAVNSFGHSGTNAHLVVKEHVSPRGEQVRLPASPMAIPLSAKTEEQLRQRCADLLAFLQQAPQPVDLGCLAWTLQMGREPMEERLGLVADSVARLIGLLQAILAGETQGEAVFRGRAQRGSSGPAPAALTADTLLRQWTHGQAVDWHLLWQGMPQPQRMSLPGYPFARERYWLATAFTPAVVSPAGGEAADDAIADILHRIADEAIAVDEGIHLLKMIV